MADVTEKTILCSPAHCLVSWFPHTSKTKVSNKFQDLAFTLAKREITRCWKAPGGPRIAIWEIEFERCAGYEGGVLLREARRGVGSIEVVRAWESLVDSLKDPEPESGKSHSELHMNLTSGGFLVGST